jgi:hypothetical protein
VRFGNKAWSEADSCLQIPEVQALADWADAVAEGREAEPRITFQEPDLALAVDRSSEPNQIVVHLDLELGPPNLDEGEASMDAYEVRLPLDPRQLHGFARALRAQLEALERPEADQGGPAVPPPPRFPSRGGRR